MQGQSLVLNNPKTDYQVGDKIDLSTLEILARDKNGKKDLVKLENPLILSKDLLEDGKFTFFIEGIKDLDQINLKSQIRINDKDFNHEIKFQLADLLKEEVNPKQEAEANKPSDSKETKPEKEATPQKEVKPEDKKETIAAPKTETTSGTEKQEVKVDQSPVVGNGVEDKSLEVGVR